MPEYLTPGVYLEFRDTALPVIRGVRTDITGFVGLAERGPLNEPVQIESWRQFQVRFGSFMPYSFLAYAVKGFFENGGQTCFIVRVAGVTATRAARTLKDRTSKDVIQINALNEGTWGDKIAITLQARPSSGEFSLLVTRGGPDRESFPRLSINPDDARYFVRIINEGDELSAPSQWIYVEDLIPLAIPRTADLLPDAAKSAFQRGTGFLVGGRDGIASLTKDDFLGDSDPLASEKKGLSAFDHVDAVAIICIPDIHIQPVLIPPTPPTGEEPPHDPCISVKRAPPVATPVDTTVLEQPPAFSEDDVADVQRA